MLIVCIIKTGFNDQYGAVFIHDCQMSSKGEANGISRKAKRGNSRNLTTERTGVSFAAPGLLCNSKTDLIQGMMFE